MEIIAALFMDDIELRSVAGPSTRIDLGGIQFSAPAPSPVPVTIAPHLVVLIWCPTGARNVAALEVEFRMEGSAADSEPMARNVQALEIEPGKFNYRLVRADLAMEEYGTVIAHCRLDQGPERVVPYTLLPPVGA